MKRRRPHGSTRNRPVLEHIDAAFLRRFGLNPEDFRDAFEGRRTSVLFVPFRDAPPE